MIVPKWLLYLLCVWCLGFLGVSASPSALSRSSTTKFGFHSLFDGVWSFKAPAKKRDTIYDTNADGSSVIWVIQDTYEGATFFDTFDFYTGPDPTDGTVTYVSISDSQKISKWGALSYVNESTAFADGLAYVNSNSQVIMKGDDTTWLPEGVNRSSVRISSQAQYNTGLFILDLSMAPWGCGVWPAFWTVGSGVWPYTGEIDVIEGVHDNEHNQVTWHTGPGCYLTPTANFTGTVVQTNGVDNLDCDSLINDNSGCGVIEWSQASYGAYFDSQGGGVFAMEWDEGGISVWSFYRAAIPQDITQGEPDPSNWGVPVATLSPAGCNITENFVNHSIVFDITFCGDWAGNSYATSGCPGTCSSVLMDPNNFVNASWIINSLKVYKQATLTAVSTNDSAAGQHDLWMLSKMRWFISVVALLTVDIVFWFS